MTLASLVFAGAAGAEPLVSTRGTPLTLAGDRAYLVQGAGARGDGIFRLQAVTHYASNPLALIDGEQARYRIVSDQVWVYPSASLALSHRFFVGIEAPLLLLEEGEPAPESAEALPETSGVAVGDPRLLARARVLGAPDALHLGLGADVSLPVGGGAYAGDGSLRLKPFVAAGSEQERYTVNVEAGYTFREGRQLPGLLPTRVGSELDLGAAAAFALDPRGHWFLGPELAAALTVGSGAKLFDPRSTLLSVLLHARYRLLGGPVELGAAFGPSLGRAPGAADYQVLFGVTFSPEEPPPPPDGDTDGVPDEGDMCPSLAGVPSNDPLMHGCPELPTESDGDGIPDIHDACPKTPGEPTGDRKTHGCPFAPDTDRDGTADPEDACLDLPGEPHSDPKRNGCPVEPPAAELVEQRIEISQEVTFETGTAVLRPESDAILAEVARVLANEPGIELVEVAGHTDDTGTPEINQRLSLQRAEAVVAWLMARGIAAERLIARGYGQTRPVTDNATPQGRARNRRVEFHVRARSSEQGGAP